SSKGSLAKLLAEEFLVCHLSESKIRALGLKGRVGATNLREAIKKADKKIKG
ncbi:hypothetical protein LCGC14_1698340, partial [marine sediment metagenome]